MDENKLEELENLEKKAEEFESNKQVVEKSAEVASEVLAPGVGKKVFNIAKNTKVGQNIINRGTEIATDLSERIPGGMDTLGSASEIIPTSGDDLLDFGSKDKDVKSSGTLLDSDKSPLKDVFKLSPMTKIYIYASIGAVFLIVIIIAVILNPLFMLNLTDGEPDDLPDTTQIALTNEEVENSLLYIGDNSVSLIQSILNNENISYLIGDDYNWLSQTGLDLLNNYLENENIRNVVASFGINDLDKIDSYINVYNNIINNNENINLYILPLVFSEEEMERLKELGITENNITEFNNRLRNAFPANFIASATTVPDENVSLNLHQEALDFIKKNSPYSFIDKYPEEKLEALEGISLLDKIGEDGIRKLEEYIQSRIDITEKCSPSGVAGAVVGLINGLHQKGVKIPHYPTGAYHGPGLVDPNWGSKIEPSMSPHGEMYHYSGLDSTGLTHWAMTAAGINAKLITFDDYLLFKHYLDFDDAYPGSLLLTTDHIGIVIENKKTHLEVAEATDSGGHFARYDKEEVESKFLIAHTVTYFNENCRN